MKSSYLTRPHALEPIYPRSMPARFLRLSDHIRLVKRRSDLELLLATTHIRENRTRLKNAVCTYKCARPACQLIRIQIKTFFLHSTNTTMYISSVFAAALFTVAIRACNPGTDGCDHPGNFTGTLTKFTDPAAAFCSAGTESSIYASIPASFYDPPDESPCDAPINVTNPSTKKTISAMVIGECTSCTGDNIQLTTAGLAALSPNGKASSAPTTVDWTFPN